MYFKNKFFIFSAVIILPSLYFLITYANKSNASINLNTTDNSVIVNGKKIYANNCASCHGVNFCLLYTSPSPRDMSASRMPSSA